MLMGMKNRDRQGHWIHHARLLRVDYWECSVCGAVVDRPAAKCPKCGSGMHGEKYDPQWVDELEIMDAIFDD